MNALDLLTSQHRHIEKLFDRFSRLRDSDALGKTDILARVAEAIAIHLALEEDKLYPRVEAIRNVEAQGEAYAEHQEMKEALAELLQLDPGDPAFTVRFRALRDQVEQHVEAEETELFPVVEQLIEDAELLELGLAMQEEVRERSTAWPDEATPALDPMLN